MEYDDSSESSEDRLFYWLDTIDEHHNVDSTDLPYTALEVVGARLPRSVRQALLALGFNDCQETPTGFVATRSKEDASHLWGPSRHRPQADSL